MKKTLKSSEVPKGSRAVIILGAGHFGQRALSVLKGRLASRFYVVDDDKESLAKLTGNDIEVVHGDAVEFLFANASSLSPNAHIIPAVPFHLAHEFVLKAVGKELKVDRIPVPAQLKTTLPHVWDGRDGSLLISYADFRCPDDCAEPMYCTVTGEKRDKPLHELLRGIEICGYGVRIIRSHQMGPGVGGYRMGELLDVCSSLISEGTGKWLLGTACRCHGVLSGLEIRDN